MQRPGARRAPVRCMIECTNPKPEESEMEIEICAVQYHSIEWMLLVEMGWITMVVDRATNTAFMLRQP